MLLLYSTAFLLSSFPIHHLPTDLHFWIICVVPKLYQNCIMKTNFLSKELYQLYEEFWMKWHRQTITMHPLKRSYLKYPLSSISMKISIKISIIFPMLGRIIESKYLFRFSSLLLHLRKKNQNKIKSCKISWIFFKMSIEHLYKQN